MQITHNLHDINNIKIMERGHPLPPAPRHRPESQTKRDAYKAAIDIYGMFHSGAAFYRQPAEVSERPPRIDIRPPTPEISIGMTPAARRAGTLGVGLSSVFFAGLGFASAVGIYGSTTREFGAFYSAGLGMWTSIGASAGPQFTYIFGGPSAFNGVSWGVGCDVDAGPLGIGATLLFALSPLRFLGYSVTFSVGTPSPPMTFSVQASNTWTKPLLQIS